MILLDTSGLLAGLDNDDPRSPSIALLLRDEARRIISPFVLAELDYLIGLRIGSASARAFVEEVGTEAYELAAFANMDVEEASKVMEEYRDLDIGLTDASLVVLSRRYACLNLLTLDERHFRMVKGAGGQPFRILPMDV